MPAGGSSPVGALGYVEAALEIAAQVEDRSLPEPAHVVVPVGTGGTAAGLALGLQLAGLRTRVVGIVVNDQLRLDAPRLARLARRTAALLERRGALLGRLRLDPGMLDLTRDQIGAGYGHPTGAAAHAAARAAEEGLSLDPVYTAKAMAGLLALRAEGSLGDRVLFVHTDGPREESSYNWRMPRRKPGTLLPLETEILGAALSMLSSGRTSFHGFGLAQAMRKESGSAALTGHGTLYKALGRLEEFGLLTSRWEDAAGVEGRPRRRLYELTREGAQVAERALGGNAGQAMGRFPRPAPEAA